MGRRMGGQVGGGDSNYSRESVALTALRAAICCFKNIASGSLASILGGEASGRRQELEFREIEELAEEVEGQDDHEEVGLQMGIEAASLARGLRCPRAQARDLVRVEVPLALDAVVGQQVVDPVETLGQHIGGAGRPEAEFLPRDDLRRYEIDRQFFKDILFNEVVNL